MLRLPQDATFLIGLEMDAPGPSNRPGCSFFELYDRGKKAARLTDCCELVIQRNIGRSELLPATSQVHIVDQILVFALFSARRISEICNLRWEDFRKEEAKIFVREMKHPRQKKRNNIWCDVPPEAMAIIRVMPRISEFVFPFDPRSVGAAFLRHREKSVW